MRERERLDLVGLTREVERNLPSNQPRGDRVVGVHSDGAGLTNTEGAQRCKSRNLGISGGRSLNETVSRRPLIPLSTIVARTKSYTHAAKY